MEANYASLSFAALDVERKGMNQRSRGGDDLESSCDSLRSSPDLCRRAARLYQHCLHDLPLVDNSGHKDYMSVTWHCLLPSRHCCHSMRAYTGERRYMIKLFAFHALLSASPSPPFGYIHNNNRRISSPLLFAGWDELNIPYYGSVRGRSIVASKSSATASALASNIPQAMAILNSTNYK